MTEIAPWFKFYTEDFWNSADVQEMGVYHAGAYLRLLSYQWEHGSIPTDLHRLAGVLRASQADAAASWALMRQCFVPVPGAPDRAVNVRIEEERAHAYDRSERLRQRATRGGEAKARKSREALKTRLLAEAAAHVERERGRSTVSTAVSSRATTEAETGTDAEAPPTHERGVEAERRCATSTDFGGENAAKSTTEHIEQGTPYGRTSEDSSLRSSSPGADAPTAASGEGDGSAKEPEDRPLLDPPVTPQAKRKDPRLERTPDDLLAYAVLEATWPLIAKQVPDLVDTPKRWRSKNKAGALALARKMTPEQAAGMLTFAYQDPEASQFYGALTRLDKLGDAIPRLVALKVQRDRGGRRGQAAVGRTHGALIG
jgi:uncharacterized protein YdaU (DUF1376 family)